MSSAAQTKIRYTWLMPHRGAALMHWLPEPDLMVASCSQRLIGKTIILKGRPVSRCCAECVVNWQRATEKAE